MKLLSVADAAKILTVSENWVKEHTYSRCLPEQRLPFIKLGKFLRFREQDLIAYVEKMAAKNKLKP
jgi:excisionase family DNA binding protein